MPIYSFLHWYAHSLQTIARNKYCAIFCRVENNMDVTITHTSGFYLELACDDNQSPASAFGLKTEVIYWKYL